MKASACAAALILICCANLTAQSLRETARRVGGDVEHTLNDELPVFSLDTLIPASDVIVYGTIRAITPHLTSDESIVVTDYTLVPKRYLKANPRLALADKPRPAKDITVRRMGGTVMDGQYRLSTVLISFPPSEEFSVGEEVIFFLKHDADAFYDLSGGPSAALRIRNGDVLTMTSHVARVRGEEQLDLVSFLEDLQRKVNAR